MAAYDYTCMQCDKTVTKHRPITDEDPGYFCEDCGNRLIRVYDNTPVVFKGKGFYKTGG